MISRKQEVRREGEREEGRRNKKTRRGHGWNVRRKYICGDKWKRKREREEGKASK